MNDKTREFDMTLPIDAEPSAVWSALTEAEELTRWFPPHAEVTPGVGGVIRLSWDEDLAGDCHIKVWEPEKHLRMTWFEPVDGKTDPSRELAVDFFIEAAHGGTVLRVNHSGFGTDESWDDEFDSVSRGWSFELRALRHYLERHFGKNRRTVMRRFVLGSTPAATWSRLLGSDGVIRCASIPEEGGPVSVTLPDGTAANGTLLFNLDGTDFAAVLDTLDGGVLRLCMHKGGSGWELWVWLASWSLERATLVSTIDSWLQSITHVTG